jgi:hypothetical protein
MDCPICGDPFSEERRPLKLPCLHSVCSICLPDLNLQCRDCREFFQTEQVHSDILLAPVQKCPEHSEEFVLFCKTCNQNICEKCISHRGHACVHWSEILSTAPDVQKKVNRVVTEIRDKKFEFASQLKLFEGHREAQVRSISEMVDREIEAALDYAERLRNWKDTTTANFLSGCEVMSKELDLHQQKLDAVEDRARAFDFSLLSMESRPEPEQAQLVVSAASEVKKFPDLTFDKEFPEFVPGTQPKIDFRCPTNQFGTLRNTGPCRFDNISFHRTLISNLNSPARMIQLKNGNIVIRESRHLTIHNSKGNFVRTIPFEEAVYDLSANPDGSFSAVTDTEVIQFSESGPTRYPSPLRMMKWSPDGRFMVGKSVEFLNIIDSKTQKATRREVHGFRDFTVNNEDVYIIWTDRNSVVRRSLTDEEDFAQLTLNLPPGRQSVSISFLPGHNILLYLIMMNGALYLVLINCETFGVLSIYEIKEHGSWVGSSVLGLRNGRILVSCPARGVIWEM